MLTAPRRGYQLDNSSGNSRRYVISASYKRGKETEIKLVYLAQSGKLPPPVVHSGFHLSDCRRKTSRERCACNNQRRLSSRSALVSIEIITVFSFLFLMVIHKKLSGLFRRPSRRMRNHIFASRSFFLYIIISIARHIIRLLFHSERDSFAMTSFSLLVKRRPILRRLTSRHLMMGSLLHKE